MGSPISVVSLGSTPTELARVNYEGITEVVYILHDINIQFCYCVSYFTMICLVATGQLHFPRPNPCSNRCLYSPTRVPYSLGHRRECQCELFHHWCRIESPFVRHVYIYLYYKDRQNRPHEGYDDNTISNNDGNRARGAGAFGRASYGLVFREKDFDHVILEPQSHDTVRDNGSTIIMCYELKKLSEEHGWVAHAPGGPTLSPQIGDRVTILVNHSCPIVNLCNVMFIRSSDHTLREIRPIARGCSQ